MSSQVVLLRCDDYRDMRTTIEQGLKLLGGISRFASPGQHILLKPNLLAPDAPESGTVTHPSVLEAVGAILKEQGVRVSYGDSPGFHPFERAAKRAGMHEVAGRLGIESADFVTRKRVYFEKGLQNKVFEIAAGVLEADGVISLPKLKTHGLTLLTGAVKNQFGCIPGMTKAGFHAKLEDLELFSQMLVDLTMYLKPRLYIMDAVIAMEGNGPRRGNPVHLGLVLLSDDPVALDSVAARVACVDPAKVMPVVLGHRSGLGDMEDVQVLGEPVDEVKKKFALPRYNGNFKTIPPFIRNLLKRVVVQRPVIHTDTCIKCLECLKICPTDPKSIYVREKDGYPVHDYNRCIRCYCCQETCPAGAIDIRIRFF
jgi:uncharacterized protein (DUF362 family)/Pyruvate/2-oxoacid:ferredoxin oxidoreductase delta subunit